LRIYPWWKFDNALDDETIEKILEIRNRAPWQTAEVMDSNNPIREQIRKTDLIWNNDQWLHDTFWGYMQDANQNAGWNLELSCAEWFQLGRYTDGGHYDFHIDDMGFKTMNGTTRKLSMVCWLNEDFEGGEFEFHTSVSNKDYRIIKPTKGTIVFFPPWLAHKVHPVTEGIRYSLVTWFRGQPVR
jgi:predicted 2-oxoglutarate/Fe(II)-dependent dioxygenase YbiX